MEKVNLQTADIAAENAAKLAELFPDIVTEVLDEDGNVRHSIDVEALKAHVGDIAEDKRERYQFTWPGKQKARAEAIRSIDKTMRPCPEESVNWDTTENLYIEGDNLDALKILRETYAGKIKMIYIDPPYNTGHDFVYNDDFARSAEEERAESGAFDEEGNLLDKAYKVNNESNGKFHSDWCSMMYPRLVLARDLLREDGVIFISIDDKERDDLIKLCSELFNESNFVGSITLKTSTDNNPGQIHVEHEYALCFARDVTKLGIWSSPSKKAQTIQRRYEALKNQGLSVGEIQERLRTWIKAHKAELQGVEHYDNVDEKGVFHDGDIANTTFGDYKYEVLHPVTKRPCKVPEKGYRYPESTMKKMIEDGDILFGDDESVLIKPKKRLSDAKDVLRSVQYEDGRGSTKRFEALMARDVFQNPKSTLFLEKLFFPVLENGDIVLDFFSGSASTAETVFQMSASSSVDAHFILVQLPEDLDLCVSQLAGKQKKTNQNATAFLDSIGKPRNICEIGKERIRRAGKKIVDDLEPGKKVPDIGFRVLKIDSSNFEDVQRTPDSLFQDALFSLADNVKPGRTTEDILFQLFPKLEIPYTARIDTFDICGKTVYSVDDDTLVACFDREVPEDVVRAMAQREPAWAVLRDASFTGDDALANFEEIFKTVSPETKTRVV